MNLIILAAGTGSRLKPLTNNTPKAMVGLGGQPMIEWTLKTAENFDFEKIIIVTGYLNECFDKYPVTKIVNSRYEETNMVESLFCASEHFDDGFILSYGDIVYESWVLDKLVNADGEISVVVDRQWKEYWQERFDDPLSDAETLVLNDNQKIVEIGKEPINYENIQGQYIGLLKFDINGVAKLKNTYAIAQDETKKFGTCLKSARGLDGLFMTDLLQGMIERGEKLDAVEIQRGWLEVDSIKDRNIAELALLEKRVCL